MRLFLIYIFYLGLLHYQSQKEPMPTTDFYISEQKITYKGQDLPFGKPIEEWVKIFGNYDTQNKRKLAKD